jgi:magnesium and cobalt transporter
MLDELLGETADEFKEGDGRPVRLPDGRIRLRGDVVLEDAATWIGIQLEADAYTLGGFVMEHLARVPVVGDRLTKDGVAFEVEAMQGRAVKSLLVTPVPSASDDE